MPPAQTSILFVCLGNICRSPLAEGIFIHHATEAGKLNHFHIDSCGTAGYHTGSPPDPRSIAIANKHNITLPSKARKFIPKTDKGFDYIIAMDTANRDDLLTAGAPPKNIHLLRSFDPALTNMPQRSLDVPDPYYGGPEGFSNIYTMINTATAGLLKHALTN